MYYHVHLDLLWKSDLLYDLYFISFVKFYIDLFQVPSFARFTELALSLLSTIVPSVEVAVKKIITFYHRKLYMTVLHSTTNLYYYYELCEFARLGCIKKSVIVTIYKNYLTDFSLLCRIGVEDGSGVKNI